jgi:hypothetical protein
MEKVAEKRKKIKFLLDILCCEAPSYIKKDACPFSKRQAYNF